MGKKFYMNEHVMALFTCTICCQLYDCPTTISECNHTFCWKCIEKKFREENLKACPVCNVDLGVAPLAGLTVDSHLQDMMSRYFVRNPESVPESNPVAPLEEPEKLDEQVTAVPMIQSSSKPTSSRVLPSSPEPNTDGPMEAEKLGEQVKDVVPQNQSSSSMLRKRPRKNPSPEKQSTLKLKQRARKGLLGDYFKIPLGVAQDYRLAGASTSRGCMQNEEIPSLSDYLGQSLSINEKEVTSTATEERYSLRSQSKRNMNSSGAGSSKESEKKLKGSNKPVWFKLIAVENQNTSRPLAQIDTPDTCYRAHDGNALASHVKKMIVQKLNLGSEYEVDLWIREERVISTLTLHTLLNWWVVTTPISEQESSMAASSGAMAGSSGADFVMVLYYSRSLLTL